MCYTTQYRTVLTIFPLILQTITIAQMLSNGGEGSASYSSLLSTPMFIEVCMGVEITPIPADFISSTQNLHSIPQSPQKFIPSPVYSLYRSQLRETDTAIMTSSSAMADRPCECLRPKSPSCSCQHCQWFCARWDAVAIQRARITWPKRHLPDAYEILVTWYDQFRTGVGHFRQIFHREGGIAHQPLLVSEN